MTRPDDRTCYQALVERDASYEGLFIVGVKTTGIFCRPTCRARKPRFENTEYFAATGDALQHGYRPCKVCHPLEPVGQPPAWLRGVLDEIDADPSLRLRDADLRERGVDPARIRRWFKQHHGMTFQAYQRARRLNAAFGRIRHTGRVTDAAFDAGYDSLSGFNEAFRKLTGFAPSASGTRTLVTVTRLTSPLGPLFAGATDEGVCLLEFTDRRMLPAQFKRLGNLLKAEFAPGSHDHLGTLATELEEYFAGTRRTFDVPLVLPGTDFQRAAWRALQEIPYGRTRTYSEQAAAVGRPTAVRAVARANGDNRLAIVVPCHRVVAADGTLAGYGGGLWRKRRLLELETGGVAVRDGSG